MKSIYLESVLAFIFVGVMAMLICGLFYNDYLEQQPATPEQLTEITQDTLWAFAGGFLIVYVRNPLNELINGGIRIFRLKRRMRRENTLREGSNNALH